MKNLQEDLAIATKKLKPSFSCSFCNKAFVKETTLLTHQCEGKRRSLKEKEQGVQIGLRAFQRFYEIVNRTSKIKTYEEFSSSPYYIAFVKFGRHMVEIRAIHPVKFINYLIKNNVRLDNWCQDKHYQTYLFELSKIEAAVDALERSIVEMQRAIDDNPDIKNGVADYFKLVHPNKICQQIANGRVSPWVIFNCNTGIKFLESLNEGQLALIIDWINPDYWGTKLKQLNHDTEWVKSILEGSGL